LFVTAKIDPMDEKAQTGFHNESRVGEARVHARRLAKANQLMCSPVSVNDFRSISLINCVVKIIMKLLGKRLQLVIIPLVHKNQYDFIKTRITASAIVCPSQRTSNS
jgi:hypothetical protein